MFACAKNHEYLYNSPIPRCFWIRFALFASRSHRELCRRRPLPPRATRNKTTMSFAVSASATRVVASARAPIKAQRASAAAAFVAPAAKANSAARLSMRSNATGVALKHAKSTVAAKAARGNMAVFAGRFETERTYIMIKPDGVQRGYVSTYPYVEYPYPSVPEPASSSIIDRSIDTPAPIQPSIGVHHDTTLTVSAPSPSLLP